MWKIVFREGEEIAGEWKNYRSAEEAYRALADADMRIPFWWVAKIEQQ